MVNNGKRVSSTKLDIDYARTLQFFDNRAKKYQNDNPYSVTMYQDDNPDIVVRRNQKEIEKLLPLLNINNKSRILDLACGIGRWSDAISVPVNHYCGIDFCGDLIKIAKERNKYDNRHFYTGSIQDLKKILIDVNDLNFNRVLFIGSLMYINDSALEVMLNDLVSILDKHSIVLIREPIGLDSRLTLNSYYSDELKDDYSAIYRTKGELMKIFEKTLLKNEFSISHEGFLFDEEKLNNRKETAQYYFVLQR